MTIGPGQRTYIRVSLSSSLISPFVGPSADWIRFYDSVYTNNVDFCNNFKSMAYESLYDKIAAIDKII